MTYFEGGLRIFLFIVSDQPSIMISESMLCSLNDQRKLSYICLQLFPIFYVDPKIIIQEFVVVWFFVCFFFCLFCVVFFLTLLLGILRNFTWLYGSYCERDYTWYPYNSEKFLNKIYYIKLHRTLYGLLTALSSSISRSQIPIC